MRTVPSFALGFGLLALGASAFGQGYGDSKPVDKETLAKLTSAQKRADAAYKKNPKSPAVVKLYVESNNRHGLACMSTDALDRKVKYKMALADFRKVLRIEPNNKVAKSNADLIVSIYKSMGRPVPGSG